ncbi:MAG: hypothetical protein U0941_29790 [Planctomycetaceae bacterium]
MKHSNGRAREIYDRQAKERQKLSEGRGKKGMETFPQLNGTARDAAGKAVGVSGRLAGRPQGKENLPDPKENLPEGQRLGRSRTKVFNMMD